MAQHKKNINIFWFISLTISLLSGCSQNHLSTDGLPVIDVTKNYPEKEIRLSDIADIMYVHLDSKHDDFLYKGSICYITENTLVVNDLVTQSVLFFSKDGAPQSRINRYGNGPEEYAGPVNNVIYDEAADDVFIYGGAYKNFIQVYSSKGEYKRKLFLPYGVQVVGQMDIFDSQSLIVFNQGRNINKMAAKYDNRDYLPHPIDSSFFLISKADGQVLEYIQMTASQNDLSFKIPTGGIGWPPTGNNIAKHTEGFLLSYPETDTVFHYSKNKELTPVISKIPPVDKQEPKIILINCFDLEKYQFMEAQIVDNDYFHVNHINKHYIRDKKTGEIFQQKIVIPDYKGKKIMISSKFGSFLHGNVTRIELDLMELKQAYRENRLSGKLKELVETLNEKSDNNIFMFVKFK